MDILKKIIEAKKQDLQFLKQEKPVAVLEKMPAFLRPVVSLAERFRKGESSGIIAEFKRRSPSKGIINDKASVSEVVSAYQQFGAAAVSVLTDNDFFGGSSEDLIEARAVLQIPLLRKEFIVDEYQVIEAKAMGADIILLIAACLSPGEVKHLSKTATILGMEVLLELHDEEELNHICEDTLHIGINNRNLSSFAVDIERSLLMAEKIPAGKFRIAESGISRPEQVGVFSKKGFDGFLIGENFMKEENPGEAFRNFVGQIKEVLQ